MVATLGKIDAEAVTKYYRKYQMDREPPFWLGKGLAPLGLEEGMPVDLDMLSVMLASGRLAVEDMLAMRKMGLAIDLKKVTKHPLHDNHRAGFDLTFSAPKSVSVLAAVLPQDSPKRNAVLAAHDAAVREAFAWLEKEAGLARIDGNVEHGGMVGAAFRHWTSRAGDPQLHTHVLIPNFVILNNDDPDRQVRALDAKELFEARATAGAIYRANLRRELAKAGLSFEDRNGTWEIKDLGTVTNRYGVPLVRRFSRRQAIIEAAVNDWEQKHEGRSLTPKARRPFVIATRKAKLDAEGDYEDMVAYTKQVLSDEFGIGDDGIEGLFGPGPHPIPQLSKLWHTGKGRYEIWRDLRGDDSTTSTESGNEKRISVIPRLAGKAHFTRMELLGALAEISANGATTEDLEAVCDHVLLDACQVLVPAQETDTPGHQMPTPLLRHRKPHYAFSTDIQAERQMLAKAVAITDPILLPFGITVAEHASEEQTRAIKWLLSGDKRVRLVAGGPGSGKTTILESVVESLTRNGYQVVGLAHQGQRADALRQIKGVRQAWTIDSFFDPRSKARDTVAKMSQSTKVVFLLDEAASLDRKRWEKVVDQVQAQNSWLLAIGDDRQVPSVEGSGVFSLLLQGLGAVHLADNHRQLLEHERNAVALARMGEGKKAVEELRRGGKIEIGNDDEDVVARAAEYVATSLAKDTPAIAVCHSRDQVKAVNRAVHEILVAQGKVKGLKRHGVEEKRSYVLTTNEDLEISQGRVFGLMKGDRVLITQNRRYGRTQLYTGQQAVLKKLTRKGDAVIVTQDRKAVKIPREDAKAILTLGYATTSVGSLGKTIDGNVVVVGADTMPPENLLVTISRARLETRLVLRGERDNEGNLSSKKTLAKLARRMGAKSEPESAHEWLLDEAEATRLARTLGPRDSKRLAAMWKNYHTGHQFAGQREHWEQLAADPERSDEERSEASQNARIAKVLEERTKTIEKAQSLGMHVDPAWAKRQARIAQRAAEIAEEAIVYEGKPLPLPQSVAPSGMIGTMIVPPSSNAGAEGEVYETSANALGEVVSKLAEQEGISTYKAARRFVKNHNLPKYAVVELAISAEIHRVAGMAASVSGTTTSQDPWMRTMETILQIRDLDSKAEQAKAFATDRSQSLRATLDWECRHDLTDDELDAAIDRIEKSSDARNDDTPYVAPGQQQGLGRSQQTSASQQVSQSQQAPQSRSSGPSLGRSR